MADNLKNIEDALNSIKSKTDFISDTVDSNFDGKISDIARKNQEILDTIGKITSKNFIGGRNKATGKINWGDFNKKIDELGGNLSAYGKAISEPVDKLNTTLLETNKFLMDIAGHITNQSSTGPTTQQSTASNGKSGKGGEGIHETVKEILGVLKDIRNGQKAKDEGLQSLIEENRKTEEYYTKAMRLSSKELKNVLKGKGKKGGAQTDDDKKMRQAVLDIRNEKKNKKNEEGGGNSGWKVAAKIAGSVASVGKALTERVTTGQTADAAIGQISNLGPGGAIFGALLSLAKSAFDIGNREQQSAADYVRQFGGNQRGMFSAQATARSLTDSPRARQLGYRVEDAYSAMTSFTEAVGRTADHLSQRDLESAVNLGKFGIGGQTIKDFDSFGQSLRATDAFFAKLYGDVSKKGLSFKAVSKAVNDNLKMAQTHTFANGLRGLAAMAEKAVQLKFNMQQVASFADKVSTIEGALQASASLSVLGGSFAQYGNPLEMLYDGLNDTEAAFERISKMLEGRAFWDSSKGEISMAVSDRMLTKEAAKAMGISGDEAINMAYNSARIKMVESQIKGGIDKETAEYIKNIAQINKAGNAYVTLNGQEKYVSGLTAGDKEALKAESQKKGEVENADLGSIYRNTMTIGEKLQAMLDFLQQKLYMMIFHGFDRLTGGYVGGITHIQEEGKKRGLSEEEINSKIAEYDKRADDEAFLKRNYGGGWEGLTLAGRRKRYAESLIGENGISPQSPDIASNVPGNGYINGRSHFNGGTLVELEKGEFVMNKISTALYSKELMAMQRGAYPANTQLRNTDTTSVMGLSKVSPTGRVSEVPQNMQRGGEIGGTIKVDIPQTITINLSGTGQIGQYDISNIIKNYVDTFMKEAQIRGNLDGFNKERFYNQSTVI